MCVIFICYLWKIIGYNKDERNLQVLITNLKEYIENSWRSFTPITVIIRESVHVSLLIPKCVLLNILTLKGKLEVLPKALI